MRKKSLSDFFEKTGTYVHMTPREQQIINRKMKNPTNYGKKEKASKN